MSGRNILVVYSAFPTRATIEDALFAFRRAAGDNVYYLNLRLKAAPAYLRDVPFDLVIFHTTFFSTRYSAAAFWKTVERARVFADMPVTKVALPQDEYINVDVVNRFYREFGIDTLFSVQPPRVWPTLYGSLEGVRIHPVLTGYLDERRLALIARLRQRQVRDIDLGYRTTGPPPAWFGRHGFLKQRIADEIAPRARAAGFSVDVSTSPADTLLGDEWYRFQTRCRFILGVEGGTSIVDFDGSIKQRTEHFVAEHPAATFEQIEAACFPGIDGTFDGYAISPRHLEACATGTCQILTRGEYNGILVADRHYIPVEKDFSNVDEVIAKMRDEKLRRTLVERAYADVVASGEYTYQSFVRNVLNRSLNREAAASDQMGPVAHVRIRAGEQADRAILRLHRGVITPLKQRLFGRKLAAT